MATLGLDDDELKSVEQMVSRISQLSSSISSLKHDLIRSAPLPPPSSFQASAQILQRNLQTILDSITENSELFSQMALHPSTNFPGRTQEHVLMMLLRSKLEPQMEERVSQGLETAHRATPEGIAVLQEVWDECRRWTQQRIAEYVSEEADDVYTKEERDSGVENVRTGLRRELEEDESDEEGEGEDEDEVDDRARGVPGQQQGAPPVVRGPEPETLMWFAARGDFSVPPNIEFERKVDVYRGLQGVSIPPEPMQQG
ncbi:unnamed protein product [Clonostachys rosea]|uniref:Mediator of RNA polymerase II transcription subunit 8 n=1 Tax=Bionectria ochroleuca TaxID=29856 RepID=A0ABY6TVY1_BIOOC|nr:unnamed protein product [Clonostachys rosea]